MAKKQFRFVVRIGVFFPHNFFSLCLACETEDLKCKNPFPETIIMKTNKLMKLSCKSD